ncbi:hypothetical protein AKJ09_03678 [Labilithrix luteola]|uniref:Uncharacterized protein n=1 Tax=Labilithrix luteola TaxID=1391654 RepID=A0A0K1PV55_9BACT|nr:hypothetical protein [Labilithrix luteola]AKU97014.1 hypothetical protein AKJ09_03678 [Labilithrix luteola]
MSWVRLERGNDWGSIYFALPGQRLNAHGQASAKTQGLPFFEGDEYRVRWPSGEETTESVTFGHYSERVSDHGNSYEVGSMLPGFQLRARGVSWFVPIDAVEVWFETVEAA